MDADLAALPDDIDALRTALTIERAKLRDAVAERDAGAAKLAVARAKASEDLAVSGIALPSLPHACSPLRSEP